MVRPAVAIATFGSMMAGFVHVAAARSHEGDAILVWLFALCAVAQMAWGVAVAIRPRPRVLLAGLVINGGAVLVWVLSRTVGIPFIDALSEAEAVGPQDLAGALFAGASVLAALRILLRPAVPPTLTLRMVGAFAAVSLVAGLPVLSAEHTHEHLAGHGHDGHTDLAAASSPEHGDHEHGAGEAEGEAHDHAGGAVDHARTSEHAGHDADHAVAGAHVAAHGAAHEVGLVGHDHTDSTHSDGHLHPTDPGDAHEHPTDPGDAHEHPTDPGDAHEHPTDPGDPADPGVPPEPPITSIDDPRLTEEQWNAAIALIVGTSNGMRGFTTEEEIVAAGYVSMGDGGEPGEYEHFVNWSYLTDEFEVDPAHIETILMKVNADGTKRVVAAVYMLTVGETMTDVPLLAGELTTWHDHGDLCFEGTRLVAPAEGGVCPVGVLVDLPPMLYAWVEANACGPFAPLDENGQDCGATPIHTH